MLSTESLRDQFGRYAEGSLSAEALEEWLASESWDMRRWVSIGLQRLIESIQATFIAYSAGSISAEDLRRNLLQRQQQLRRSLESTKRVEEDRKHRRDAAPLRLAAMRASEAESRALILASPAA